MSQAGAASCAAASQDLTAISGCPSLAEAVFLGALKLLGLIGTRSSHCVTPPKNFAGGQRPLLLDGGENFSTAAVADLTRCVMQRREYYTKPLFFCQLQNLVSFFHSDRKPLYIF